jgi:hypothetical protein
MSAVNGTYRSGKVLLDQEVDWPEGLPVKVLSASNAQDAANNEQTDRCFDGSAWEDTPEGVSRWLEWFDSLEPVFSSPELEQFEADLRAARNEQAALLPHWQQESS